GRFLEHSRVMNFCNGGDAEWWLGSADLMHRNLDRRVETMVRVSDPEARRILGGVLEGAMSDETASWRLRPDGTFTYVKGKDLQAELIKSHRLAQAYEPPTPSAPPVPAAAEPPVIP
ncbi:MAG: polyphosphate kinase, partial [Actinomycetota bacterium]|nr:polyphosphate kinase [Actinomycetota bacterium]